MTSDIDNQPAIPFFGVSNLSSSCLRYIVDLVNRSTVLSLSSTSTTTFEYSWFFKFKVIHFDLFFTYQKDFPSLIQKVPAMKIFGMWVPNLRAYHNNVTFSVETCTIDLRGMLNVCFIAKNFCSPMNLKTTLSFSNSTLTNSYTT